MSRAITFEYITSWIFTAILLIIGLLNIFLVHTVPGIIYLFLALIYSPPANIFLRTRIGFSIPMAVKVILFIVITMFTLGVSDLGDMLDKLAN